jgi:hypothetical protein
MRPRSRASCSVAYLTEFGPNRIRPGFPFAGRFARPTSERSAGFVGRLAWDIQRDAGQAAWWRLEGRDPASGFFSCVGFREALNIGKKRLLWLSAVLR